MEKFLLTILDGFAWVFRLLHADYEQLRAIVAVKLLTDNRRQHISYRRKNQKESGRAFIMTLFFYSIFGGFVAIVMYSIPSFMLSMIVFFSYIMVMIAMTLITDFSSILLDTSDNTIILPRPVDGRTLFIARITHILLYLGQLGIGLSLIPAIAVLIKFGTLVFWFFLPGIGLSILTSVFLTNAIYLLILQFSSEEKLKNVINYFQIGMAVAIMGGYQILPRILERLDMQTFAFEITWWHFLLPPIWMAGALEGIYASVFDAGHLTLAACALIIPPVGAYLVNKYLTPVFSRKLGAMGSATPAAEKSGREKRSILDKISNRVTSTPVERGAFDLVFKILGRDRKIKLKIYPAFGYTVIFGLIFIIRGKEDFATTWANLPDTEYHLALLYIIFMVLQVALYEIPYSDDFKASWIYFSTPLTAPGEVLTGMLKAIFARLFIPGYLAISLFVVFIWGWHSLSDVAFGLFNNYLMLLILATVNKRYLPFSMAPDVRNQSGTLLRSILTFLILGILGVIHYLLIPYPLLLMGLIPAQLAVVYFLQRSYARTRWSQITV